jgi:hypothetical protein
MISEHLFRTISILPRNYKYYNYGDYPSSCPSFKNTIFPIGLNCLRLQVEFAQLGRADRVSPYSTKTSVEESNACAGGIFKFFPYLTFPSLEHGFKIVANLI